LKIGHVGLISLLLALLVSGCSFESISLDEGRSTGLSKVVINSEKKIDSKDDYKKIDTGLFDGDGGVNLFDAAGGNLLVSGKAKLRGNSTLHGVKKPYTIKLDERVAITDIFGSELTHGSRSDLKANRFILLTNYADSSMMRNDIAHSMAGSPIVDGRSMFGFDWTVNHRYVDMYMNNDYKGTYLLTEHTQNIVDHLDFSSDEANFGYMVEQDWNFDEEPKFRSNDYDLQIMVKWPDYDDVSYTSTPSDPNSYYLNTIVPQIEDRFNDKMAALANGSWSEIEAEIDVASFVKVFLFANLTDSDEYYYPGGSMFLYQKTLDGKLYFGPIWDYDHIMHNNRQDSLMFVNDYYFKDLFSHSEFREKLKNCWNQLKRDGYISDVDASTADCDTFRFLDYIDEYIDAKKREIAASYRLNSKVYSNRIMYVDEQMLTLDGQAYMLKRFMHKRAETLDEQIGAL